MAIAQVNYYSDRDGVTTELSRIRGMKNAEFAVAFPGVKGLCVDSHARLVGSPADDIKTALPVTRYVEFKKRASLHKCDARCQNSTGHVCECSCRGKNHGHG